MNIRAASIRRPVGGEGNFDAGVRKSSESKLGLKPYLRFRITQHNRDIKLLELLIDYFKSGRLETNPKKSTVNLVIGNFSSWLRSLTNFIYKIFNSAVAYVRWPRGDINKKIIPGACPGQADMLRLLCRRCCGFKESGPFLKIIL